MNKKFIVIGMLVVLTTTLLATLVFAEEINNGILLGGDDGPLFQRNLSRTPHTLSMGAQISVMPLYVDVQSASGSLVVEGIEYLSGNCSSSDPSTCLVVDTMYEAKPLIATYEDGIVHEELNELLGITGGDAVDTGTGFGQRDAFASISLDDGATWKDTNLSNSADRSSIFLKTTGEAYPGDVFRIEHEVVGNRVAVAWISRYCETGAPLYSWDDDAKDALLADEAYPELDNEVTVVGETDPYQMYLDDLFGVAGSQGSVDYTLQGFPEVGEIPFGCVWVARGTLEQDEEGLYEIAWRQAERLTSGRRDANRVDITGTSGAGFIISWQEDPEGLRPGKGLGPGEGWSGAIANSKTDIWYSYIAWDHFDDVMDGYAYIDPATEEIDLLALDSKPKIAVPFAVPVRLTDNNKCEDVDSAVSKYQPYCMADFNGDDPVEGVPGADLCATSEIWTPPNGTASLDVCVTEDGRHLTGRTASTRVRWALKPYDSDGDGAMDSAWVVMAEEKMKALGDPTTDDDPIDIGKNMWYHTFEFNKPELVQQGLMLNAPAFDPASDPENPVHFEPFPDDWGNDLYETEIARRFNLMVQGVKAAMDSPNRTSAILLFKEGILFQGGPADIFMRRVEIPEPCEDNPGEGCFDPTVDNPFDYEYVVCDAFGEEDESDWLIKPEDENPNYVRGLCGVQGVNVSATTAECSEAACDPYTAWFDTDGKLVDSLDKVTSWTQSGPDYGELSVADWGNLDDPSWANPYDVSKGHRGFIDGDFVMLMYATAPNWKANTIGNEAYNLYIRRSFDGGQTWTTTPAEWDPEGIDESITWEANGTNTCEDYGWGGTEEIAECTEYEAGDFEQARNVSRLTGSKITVLDPRYSPNGGMLKLDYEDLLCDDDADGVWENCEHDVAPYDVEIRDPSGYFVTYEVGDNTVVTVDTSTVPMDMFFSRAYNWGDDYAVSEELENIGEPETVYRWNWLEHGPDIASEASVTADPAGTRFYSVWNQELEIAEDVYTDMDVQFRRIYFNLSEEESAEVPPSASILYQSDDIVSWDTEEVVLVGTGRDHDNLGEGDGITNVRWWSDIQGHEFNERTWKFPPKGLIPGWHGFHFQVQDNEGTWSEPVTTYLIITVDGTIEAFIPGVVR